MKAQQLIYSAQKQIKVKTKYNSSEMHHKNTELKRDKNEKKIKNDRVHTTFV